MDAAGEIAFAVKPPGDYVATYGKFFDLVEDGKADEACALMAGYLDRHDAQFAQALAVLG